MKNTIMLLIPLGLGLAAAFVNYAAVSSSSKSMDFIVATRDIKVGEEFTPESIERAKIPAVFAEHLVGAQKSESAIAYGDIGQVLAKMANRKIHRGDLIFYPDVRGEPDLREGEKAQTVPLEDIRVAPGLMRVGDFIEFRVPQDPDNSDSEAKWIGPFRLVSVGKTIVRDVTPEESDSNVRDVTVAVGKDDSMATELGDFVDRVVEKKAELIAVRIFQN